MQAVRLLLDSFVKKKVKKKAEKKDANNTKNFLA
jgi:hypothetical protein